jgi:hypothetical protein
MRANKRKTSKIPLFTTPFFTSGHHYPDFHSNMGTHEQMMRTYIVPTRMTPKCTGSPESDPEKCH